jgi:hypothetical protein
MESIIELFSKVSDVIWSAIIASCITIFGVYLTNKYHERRQTTLLAHEKQKYQSEQKFTLIPVKSSTCDITVNLLFDLLTHGWMAICEFGVIARFLYMGRKRDVKGV